MDSYPAQLQYNNINPKGFFSTFKQWTIQPLASGGVFWPGQNVKILIQSVIAGVMDPYRSHLQFEVQVDESLMPIGLLQVDSSAQSFIEQLVINSKNRQIQRIPQYSVLAAWLTDCGLSQMYAQGRQTQGLGYTNVENISNFSNPNITTTNTVVCQYTTTVTNGQGLQTAHGSGNIFPTQNSSHKGVFLGTGAQNVPKYESYSPLKGHITLANSAYTHKNIENDQGWPVTNPVRPPRTVALRSIDNYGYIKNLRAEYLEAIQSKAYPDSTTSFPSNSVKLNSQIFQDKNGNNVIDATWRDTMRYKPVVPQTNYYKQNLSKNASSPNQSGILPNTTSLQGFTSLYSPNFCKGVRQPFISATVPQCQMKNGRILNQKIAISKRTFKVPIISAILGLLIPEDQFVLIPIRALNQILMEFVIDKYAMFTSGYNDISEFDIAGMSVMQNRAFSIKRVYYKMHTYQFYEPQIDQYLSQSLMSKIVLNVNMWTLGNQYQVIKGQNLNNSWPVACTSQALNQIVVLFYPLDYQHYSFCRKHFRLSNNITKFQLRINMDYYPSQPIIGNGGNPCLIENQDNSAFVQQIFWSNNFMFNKVNPWPRINAYNFAINDRCYDIRRQDPLYDEKILADQTAFVWKSDSVNQDTALGMPWIHENRYVGKAGYVFGFEPYAHSAYHLTGIDCRQIRQFDVILNTHPSDNFPREQTMYIFTRSSTIVQFTQNGVNVYGR